MSGGRGQAGQQSRRAGALPLIDYVQFAQTCQNLHSGGDFDRAFLANGAPRSQTDQSDGPALQTLAILERLAQLDAPTQAVANAVIAAKLDYGVLGCPGGGASGGYQGGHRGLISWERFVRAPRRAPVRGSCAGWRP